MTHEKIAREIVDRYNLGFIDQENNTPRPALVHWIAAALREVERETWDRVSKCFDKKFSATGKRMDLTRDYRVDEFYNYCRVKANGEP